MNGRYSDNKMTPQELAERKKKFNDPGVDYSITIEVKGTAMTINGPSDLVLFRNMLITATSQVERQIRQLNAERSSIITLQ